MNGLELTKALYRVKTFGEVIPADQLPIEPKNKFYVVNNDPSTKPGRHWLAVYMGQVPEFFDSLGQSPSSYNKDFENFLINHGPNYKYNTMRIQNDGSDMCGGYCIYYIILRNLGYSMKEVVNTFSSVSLEDNDNKVKLFLREYFKRIN